MDHGAAYEKELQEFLQRFHEILKEADEDFIEESILKPALEQHIRNMQE